MRRVRIVLAGLIGLGGFVHLRIWQHEYRHVRVREMFVANWVASAVVVLLLLVVIARPRLDRLVLSASLLVSIGSLIAFGLSRGPGVPTLHGTFTEHGLETTSSYVFNFGSAKTILVAEGLAAAISAAELVRTRRRGRRGGGRPLHRDQRSSSGGN
ncbi:MAG: hypothetical protein ACYDH6_01840 [Acidimicrobiales bacterium]